MPAWLLTSMSVMGMLAALLLIDSGLSYAFMTRDRKMRVVPVPSRGGNSRKWIILKGFSNPLEPFVEGMKAVTDDPMLIVHYGLCPDTYLLFDCILEGLRTLDGPREIAIYGHSRGGHIGRAFLKWYEDSGSPYGPISELFLDCTPGNSDSLPAPRWIIRLMRGFLKVYRGGPLLALFVAVGNLWTRKKMPAPLDDTTDRKLYKRYARGLMWYNNRAWVLEMLSMLNEKLPAAPQETNARVIYIGAQDPSRDKLVRQEVAIKQLRTVFPGMIVIRDKTIGHAWPMEQPVTYRRIVESVLSTSER